MVPTRVALAVPLVALLLAAPAAADPAQSPAGPPSPVVYQLPVPGPVVDPYRPPSTPYGPGNRGIDFATTPGERVVAPADGVVTFAGAVAGALHVVLLHSDGIRTSLSFLSSVLVTRGQQVVRGQSVGLAGSEVHFGARRGEVYLDPSTLLNGAPDTGARSVLVPDGPGRALAAADEAAGLSRLLAGVVSRAGPTGASARDATPPDATPQEVATQQVVAQQVATEQVAAQQVAALGRAAAAAGAPAAWVVMAGAAGALAEQEPCSSSCRSSAQLLGDAALGVAARAGTGDSGAVATTGTAASAPRRP